jgi:hypothetical protein
MSCIIYTMSCNSTTHATCLLELIVYKYIELQGQLQNTLFFIVVGLQVNRVYIKQIVFKHEGSIFLELCIVLIWCFHLCCSGDS